MGIKKNVSKMKCQYKIFGISFIIIGILLIGVYQYRISRENKLDDEAVDIYFEKQEEALEDITNEEIIEEKEESKESSEPLYEYIGVLEIPSINFKRGFLDMNDKNNTVSKNIQVLKDSDYPDVVNGNLIIAGHSGSGRIAFFKNLYKLSSGDESYIYYKNKKYIYKMIESYEVQKTGIVPIKNYSNKTILTLITCSQDEEKQIVFINELIEVI
ncbi:MAG: sortase [Bacilli bacterium]|nr:sortase [Bacilli bacterium]